MNHDELSYFNLQLAGMLRSGIPLEGALRQLSRTMHRSRLRRELEQLEQALAGGAPLAAALEARALPEFYKQMVLAGARSQDFPGLLTLLADYYRRAGTLWLRLKGLMVYPALLLLCSFGLSLWFAVLHSRLNSNLLRTMHPSSNQWFGYGKREQVDFDALGYKTQLKIWLPPTVIGSLVLVAGCFAAVPRIRQSLRWRLPAFREAHLAQFASTLALLMQSGSRLEEAVKLLASLEKQSPLGTELARWQQRMADGHGKFADLAADSPLLPPMFVWLVASAGEDLTTGLQRAAEAFQKRAAYQAEVLLYAALPASIVVMGLMVLVQVYPIVYNSFNMFRNVFGFY
ncbi:MAG: type II secretion system F family protein [Verrucomicrobiota bacterium]